MRKKIILILILIVLPPIAQSGGNNFDLYFSDKTMRIDYYHIADAKEEIFTLDQVYCQGIWAGSRENLLDNFNMGRYYIHIRDAVSGELLFSKGFDSYCGEYRTTGEASKGIKRTYNESVLIPYPKKNIIFEILTRDRKNNLSVAFSTTINPDSISIIKEKPNEDIKVFELLKSGDPHKKVDIALVAEGYTKEQEDKLSSDLKKYTEVFLNFVPYKNMRDRFNIYGVWLPSQEAGCDEPPAGIFRNTSVNASYNALGSERYLLTEDNKSLRNIAAAVPYDVLMIMVNQTKYGGGGIYNHQCTFATDNQWSEYVFLHEFGHCFAGLADEYYTSSVAYNEFYPAGIEPLEPNISALLDPSNLKWKQLVSKGTEVPTPWEKEDYDKMDTAYQKTRSELNEIIAKMKREGYPAAEIARAEAESERLSREAAQKMDSYLQKSSFVGKLGAFEGAGYASKGLYRPMLDCIMFTKGNKPFCKVCEAAIIRMIDHYAD